MNLLPTIQYVCVCLGVFMVVNSLTAQDLLITQVRIVEVEKGKNSAPQDVLIKDGKITAIGASLRPVDGVKVLDGQGKWLCPGLVDAHVHLFQSGGLYTRPDVIDLRAYKPYDEEQQWLVDHRAELLNRYLYAGITTIIDIGGPMQHLEMPERATSPSRPNLYLTGPLISTYQPKEFELEDPPIVLCNSPEEARALVQKQLPLKPDFIKIWYIVLPGQSAEKTYPVVKATIEESHANGLRVMVHATQLPTAKLALTAGADILVHSVDDPIDAEFVSLLQQTQAAYIPTLIVGQNYLGTFAQDPFLTPYDFELADPIQLGSLYDGKHLGDELLNRYLEYVPTLMPNRIRVDSINRANLAKLHAEGITIATGTDAGNIGTMHASSYYAEIAQMEAAGLTPAQILKASTLGGALIAGQVESLGSIEIGKRADALLLDADPLEDLRALSRISYVIKDGHAMVRDSLLPVSPELLAQQQLNAYNARNIEAFLAPYHDSVEIYAFPNQLRYIGKAKMRETYGNMFERIPTLHCELVHRVVMGNTVIDEELVTGFGGEEPFHAVAIYKIEDQKIRRVYFVSGN